MIWKRRLFSTGAMARKIKGRFFPSGGVCADSRWKKSRDQVRHRTTGSDSFETVPMFFLSAEGPAEDSPRQFGVETAQHCGSTRTDGEGMW